MRAKKVRKSKKAEIKIYTIGAPKYRIDVSASDYESAEELLNRAVEEALLSIKEMDGEGRKLS
jgi:translation initiation factor 2 subunit 1